MQIILNLNNWFKLDENLNQTNYLKYNYYEVDFKSNSTPYN